MTRAPPIPSVMASSLVSEESDDVSFSHGSSHTGRTGSANNLFMRSRIIRDYLLMCKSKYVCVGRFLSLVLPLVVSVEDFRSFCTVMCECYFLVSFMFRD